MDGGGVGPSGSGGARTDAGPTLDVLPVGVVQVDADRTVLGANASALALLGARGDGLVGRALEAVVDPVDRGPLARCVADAVDAGAERRLRVPVPEAGCEVLFRAVPLPGSHGGGALVTVEDAGSITATDPLLAAMRAVVDRWPGFVGIADDRGNIVHLNARARELLGLGAEEALTGLRTVDVFTGDAFARYYQEIRPVLVGGGTWSGELELVRADGRGRGGRPVRMLLTAGVGPGGTVDWLVAVSGAEPVPPQQDDLAFRAHHDDLTGLANRSLFLDRLRLALLRRDRARHPVTVAFVDLDGFKAVNDDAGHAVGDELLREVARRIVGAVRPADTVARWGGDEFVVLCEDTPDGGTLGRRIAEAVADGDARVGDRGFAVGASVGTATSPPGPSDASELVAAADAAMYRAKSGR